MNFICILIVLGFSIIHHRLIYRQRHNPKHKTNCYHGRQKWGPRAALRWTHKYMEQSNNAILVVKWTLQNPTKYARQFFGTSVWPQSAVDELCHYYEVTNGVKTTDGGRRFALGIDRLPGSLLPRYLLVGASELSCESISRTSRYCVTSVYARAAEMPPTTTVSRHARINHADNHECAYRFV